MIRKGQIEDIERKMLCLKKKFTENLFGIEALFLKETGEKNRLFSMENCFFCTKTLIFTSFCVFVQQLAVLFLFARNQHLY